MKHVKGAVHDYEVIVKQNSPHITATVVKDEVLHPTTAKIPDPERKEICKNASRAANNFVSKVKKKVSDGVRRFLGMKVNESLQGLNVSEACFNDICELVEAILRKV